MNSAVSFFVGCLTFILMMLLKMPIKKVTWNTAQKYSGDEASAYARYKHYNFILFPLVGGVSVGVYYILYRLLDLDHFQLCCTLKAGAIAIAIYAVYELWFGSDEENKREKRRNKENREQ